MRTPVPEKIIRIIDEIDAKGNANLTRLTVLKKWFEYPGRLPAFGLWVAAGAASRKGEATGTAELFDRARALLVGRKMNSRGPDRAIAETLHRRLRDFQSEYQHQRWASVRIIQNWDLLLIEEGLDLYLWHRDSPYNGYKLAVDYCQHYDPRYGNGLNGLSRSKLEEIVRFMLGIEASENGAE